MAEIYNVVAAEAITKGQALYQTTSGTYGLAQADELAKRQWKGVALEAVNAGEGLSMLKHGILAGYTLGTYEDDVYLSDTAGAFSTTIGTLPIFVGRVMSLADKDLTEVLFVHADWTRGWGDVGRGE